MHAGSGLFHQAGAGEDCEVGVVLQGRVHWDGPGGQGCWVNQGNDISGSVRKNAGNAGNVEMVHFFLLHRKEKNRVPIPILFNRTNIALDCSTAVQEEQTSFSPLVALVQYVRR